MFFDAYSFKNLSYFEEREKGREENLTEVLNELDKVLLSKVSAYSTLKQEDSKQ